MNTELNHVRELVVVQNEQRKLWKQNSSPEFLSDYVREEYDELQQAISAPEGEQSRLAIASEIGDVEYLSIRLEEVLAETGEDFPEELIPLRTNAWQLATQMGIDVGKAVHMKLIRNDLKYPAILFNDGLNYEEARALSQQMWQEIGGDKAFYKWYEKIFGEV